MTDTNKVDAEPSCNTHPDAPHGFDRNGSHNAGRYVCECEGWTAPEKVEPVAWMDKFGELYKQLDSPMPTDVPLVPASALAEARAEVERITGEWAALSQDQGKAEREIERLKTEVERLTKAQADTKVDVEPVKFLANGTRFKLSYLDDYDEDGEPTGATYVSCFEGFEKELDGRWVALVAAENDCHMNLTTNASALAAEQAKVRELVDCIEDLLDAVPPLWECAERAVDLLERIGERK